MIGERTLSVGGVSMTKYMIRERMLPVVIVILYDVEDGLGLENILPGFRGGSSWSPIWDRI